MTKPYEIDALELLKDTVQNKTNEDDGKPLVYDHANGKVKFGDAPGGDATTLLGAPVPVPTADDDNKILVYNHNGKKWEFQLRTNQTKAVNKRAENYKSGGPAYATSAMATRGVMFLPKSDVVISSVSFKTNHPETDQFQLGVYELTNTYVQVEDALYRSDVFNSPGAGAEVLHTIAAPVTLFADKTYVISLSLVSATDTTTLKLDTSNVVQPDDPETGYFGGASMKIPIKDPQPGAQWSASFGSVYNIGIEVQSYSFTNDINATVEAHTLQIADLVQEVNRLQAEINALKDVTPTQPPAANTAPKVSSTFATLSARETTSVVIPYTVTDTEGGALTATLTKDGVVTTQTISTGANSWSVGALSVGKHVFTIKVKDSGNLTSNTLTFNHETLSATPTTPTTPTEPAPVTPAPNPAQPNNESIVTWVGGVQ